MWGPARPEEGVAYWELVDRSVMVKVQVFWSSCHRYQLYRGFQRLAQSENHSGIIYKLSRDRDFCCLVDDAWATRADLRNWALRCLKA